VKVFNKGKSRNTLTVCSSPLPLHPASEIQAVSSSKIRWEKIEKVKEKFGGKKSTLIFAPRFWKSERKGRGLRGENEKCWKKNLVRKILILSLQSAQKKSKSSSIKNVYHAENFWKILEEKFGRNKKALTFATPIKREAK